MLISHAKYYYTQVALIELRVILQCRFTRKVIQIILHKWPLKQCVLMCTICHYLHWNSWGFFRRLLKFFYNGGDEKVKQVQHWIKNIMYIFSLWTAESLYVFFLTKKGLTIIKLRVWILTGNQKMLKKAKFSVLFCLRGMHMFIWLSIWIHKLLIH